MLEELSVFPLTSRQERILRTIAAKFYKRGYCFAKHETIATAARCGSKSTVQLDLDELEARGLVCVQRRPGTSNLTILGPGLIEALRTMRIERRRKELLARRGTLSVCGHVQAYKKMAAIAIEELTSFARETVSIASTKLNDLRLAKSTTNVVNFEKKVAQDFDFFVDRPKAVPQPRKRIISLPSNYISNLSSCNNIGIRDDVFKEIVDELTAEGVTPRRAQQLIALSGIECVKRNLALGFHKHALNPGGYLAEAIRQDYASMHPVAGSEAAKVREQETKARQPIARPTATSPKPKLTPTPLDEYNLTAIEFDSTAEVDRRKFEEQAREDIITSPPFWAANVLAREGIQGPSIQGAIRTKAIALWKSYQNSLARAMLA